MKRYCDYDYDNNCIILFDADDAEQNNDPFQLNVSWISSGDKKDKKYHAAILKKQNQKKKVKMKESKTKSNLFLNHDQMPLYQHLETKYDETKAMVKQQKLSRKMAKKKKQRIESMAAYQNMSPISNVRINPNQNQNQIQYAQGPRQKSLSQTPSPAPYSPQPHPHLAYGIPSPPKYYQQQQQYMNNMHNMHNMMNPNYAMNVSMNGSMIQNMQNNMFHHQSQQQYRHKNNNNNNGNYHRGNVNISAQSNKYSMYRQQ